MPGLCIIPERALADSEVTGARLRALCAIGTFTNRDGGGVWAANETIAERAKMDEREFRRAAAWLVERGYVRKRVRYKATGAQDTNQLQIVLDDPADEAVEGGGGNPPTRQQGEGETPPPPLGEIPPPRGGGNPPTKRTPLTDPTTNTTAPVGLADEFADPLHREAYVALRARHKQPAMLDLALRAVHAPPTGGPAFAWATIGAGLVDQLGNGETFNLNRLRGYCRRELAGGAAPAISVTREILPGGFVGSVRVGAQQLTAAQFWDLCVTHGLTAAMQTGETICERIADMHAAGVVQDPQAFAQLVAHVEPWRLAEIKFAKTREERLAAAIGAWREPAQGVA